MRRSRKRKSSPELAREDLSDLVIIKKTVTRKRLRFKLLTMHTKKSSRQRWHEVLFPNIKASSGSRRDTMRKSEMVCANSSMNSDEAIIINGSKTSTREHSTSIHWKVSQRVKAMAQVEWSRRKKERQLLRMRFLVLVTLSPLEEVISEMRTLSSQRSSSKLLPHTSADKI
jgi:hypothetical protein